MRYVGFSEYFHNANIAIIDEDGTLEFASESERYSGRKFDKLIYPDMWELVKPDDYVQFAYAPWGNDVEQTLNQFKRYKTKTEYLESTIIVPSHLQYDGWNRHHVSHTENGMVTRPWTSVDDTVVVSVDGSGEIESTLITDGHGNFIHEHLWPHSLGAIYNKVTEGLGYKFGEEYIVMGLAAYGEVNQEYVDWFRQWYYFWETEEGQEYMGERDKFAEGIWKDQEKHGTTRRKVRTVFRNYVMEKLQLEGDKPENIAASVQRFFEEEIVALMKEARKYGSKLVYTGGCAQNVVANSLIYELFDEVHIPTAPHDGGNGLGCAAHAWKEQTGGTHLKWTPYSGHNIDRELDPKEVAQYLTKNKVCGVANGKAEYGPRALGNRSLLADVRYDIKDTVNDIKRRQRFRPFAPAILSEYASDYFDGPMSEYMQYAAKAKHDYSSVTHVDGTARVQLVTPDCDSKIRQILEEYYELTGVPMLLNTSLNIRGKPMVNNIKDAVEWEKEYKVKVF